MILRSKKVKKVTNAIDTNVSDTFYVHSEIRLTCVLTQRLASSVVRGLGSFRRCVRRQASSRTTRQQ